MTGVTYKVPGCGPSSSTSPFLIYLEIGLLADCTSLLTMHIGESALVCELSCPPFSRTSGRRPPRRIWVRDLVAPLFDLYRLVLCIISLFSQRCGVAYRPIVDGDVTSSGKLCLSLTESPIVPFTI